jgi:hypothetical protein
VALSSRSCHVRPCGQTTRSRVVRNLAAFLAQLASLKTQRNLSSMLERPLLGHRVATCANLLVWLAMMAFNATAAREIVQTSELTARTSGGILLL